MVTNCALIIGANSQDGKYLSKLLLNKKYKVYALYNNNKKKLDKRLISVNINLNNSKNIHKFLIKFKNLKIFYFPSINISSIENEKSLELEGNSEIGLYCTKLSFNSEVKL